MQIVIDKKVLVDVLKICLYSLTGADYKDTEEAVNGILDRVGYVELPEKHGRLIDADDIALIDEQFCTPSDYYVAENAINDAPTIIEATEEQE